MKAIERKKKTDRVASLIKESRVCAAQACGLLVEVDRRELGARGEVSLKEWIESLEFSEEAIAVATANILQAKAYAKKAMGIFKGSQKRERVDLSKPA